MKFHLWKDCQWISNHLLIKNQDKPRIIRVKNVCGQNWPLHDVRHVLSHSRQKCVDRFPPIIYLIFFFKTENLQADVHGL